MKKIGLILMSLVMLLSFVGCDMGSDSFDETNGIADVEETEAQEEKDEAVVSDNKLPEFQTAQKGDIVSLGIYEQDNDMSNGKEPIEWIVLDKKDNQILLISRYLLDFMPYDDQFGNPRDVTWESCTLRKWLNGDFFYDSFSEEEQSVILTTKNQNLNSEGFYNEEYELIYALGGNDTEDKVFLLDHRELNTYFVGSVDRASIATRYAMSRSNTCGNNGQACWWTRQIGNYQNWGTYVAMDGLIQTHGIRVFDAGYAVRPAMWITGDGSTIRDTTSSDSKLPEVQPTQVGDIITFGNYEQDDNIENGKEPIEWIVLEKEEGRMLIISKYALDFKQYDSSDKNLSEWSECTLRLWLNDEFINDAFSGSQNKKVLSTEIEGDTVIKDKVFLLSIDEAEKYFKSNNERICYGYPYGATSSAYGRLWWLRKSNGQDYVPCCGYTGDLSGSAGVSNYNAVRPAMWIEIDS